MKVKKIAPDDIFYAPSWDEMLKEYTEECANTDISLGGTVDKPRYRDLYEKGLMDVLGAYEDGELVGFTTVVYSPVLHFSKLLAATESLFLKKAHRKAGNGLRLIRAVKAVAKERGADGLYFSAPVGSSFERLCRALGLRASNTAFYVGLGNE